MMNPQSYITYIILRHTQVDINNILIISLKPASVLFSKAKYILLTCCFCNF